MTGILSENVKFAETFQINSSYFIDVKGFLEDAFWLKYLFQHGTTRCLYCKENYLTKLTKLEAVSVRQ